jgi:hypothetical protein
MLMSVPTMFETCKPRADVHSGATRDEQFVADLSQVLRGTAPDEYKKPESFFHLTYPTRGLKELLKAVVLIRVEAGSWKHAPGDSRRLSWVVKEIGRSSED